MSYSYLRLWLGACLLALSHSAADARTVTVLHSFSGPDGASPASPPAFDKEGNMYGITRVGGNGYGTVFKLAADGTFSVLYAFEGGADGAYPIGSLVVDHAGNVYGIAQGGGILCANTNENGCGTVFKVPANGSESTLHAFAGGSDGYTPTGGVIADGSGNLYGTTELGGIGCNGFGCGTVYRIAQDGTETVLYAFAGGKSDGSAPIGNLLIDGSGNLYGTTQGGGGGETGDSLGTVFELSRNGPESILYSFQGGLDGAVPDAGLTMDAAGNLYGATDIGGALGEGSVFKLAPDGTETVLHSFSSLRNDAPYPAYGTPILDREGNLYGIASGGKHTGKWGIVYKLEPSGREHVLHAFRYRGLDGSYPIEGLVAKKKKLYGTTFYGGASNMGAIYMLNR